MGKLFIYVFLLIGTIGCAPRIFKGMESDAKKKIAKEDLYPFLNAKDSIHVFNMQIDFKENNYAGLLIVKHTKHNSSRAVFTSVFGLTVFDFEFSETEFKVHRCIEPIQKKVVLNLFKKDFTTLFLYNVPPTFKAKIYRGDNSIVGYKANTYNGKVYFLANTKQKELQKVQIPGCFTLLNIDYNNFDNHFPKHISIVHPRIKLSMQLERTK